MRILLVEDDIKIATFIMDGMRQAGYLVEHAADGADGFTRATIEPFDAAIVDIMLPKLDGLTLIESLRKQNIGLPVLILSARQSVDDRVRGLQSGGDDYLTKPFAFSELLARVQALIRRAKGTAEPTQLAVEDLQLDLLRREVTRNGVAIDLQPKEFILLAYLMRNAGRIVSRTMIMENVWGYHFDPQTNVVEARMSKLRDKVDAGHDIKLIHTVRGAGYVLKGRS